jgi:hypothetical protein
MNLITADTLDRSIDCYYAENHGLVFNAGGDIVSDMYLFKQYKAAIRIIKEMEARRVMVAEYDANLIADMGRPA